MASSRVYSSSSFSSNTINAAIHVPKLPKFHFSVPKLPNTTFNGELNMRADKFTNTIPIENNVITSIPMNAPPHNTAVTAQLYAILEAVADRVEIHNNMGEQRNNWNTLLLNSINMITLAATTMAGVAATSASIGGPILALKLSSTLLFSAATGMLVVMMNKIQPSQLAEEQRNASRLFRQIQSQVQTILALRTPTKADVKETMEKVLALDKAYPLPLLGTMLDKFPKTLEPAVWWPSKSNQSKIENKLHQKIDRNGWNEELEAEMREIIEVIKRKDTEDYVRLGNLALKINKILAISGPLLTGIAAVGTAFMGSPNGSSAAIVATVAGALAGVVNTFEHAGQVGMVVEMYRNCAGFFTLMEESIQSAIDEKDVMKRENGELFEMKMGLQLGRSCSQLRDLAKKSAYCRVEGTAIDEFGSKLF